MMHAENPYPPLQPPHNPGQNTDLEKSLILQQNELENERLLTHELQVHRIFFVCDASAHVRSAGMKFRYTYMRTCKCLHVYSHGHI